MYESIWAKVKVGKGRFNIIGNVYRLNSDESGVSSVSGDSDDSGESGDSGDPG